MKIQINKSQIFTEVEKASSYAGKKSNQFDLISMTSVEYEAIENSFNAGFNIIVDLLKTFIDGETNDNNNSIIELSLRSPHINDINKSSASAITSSVNIFLINYIIANWLRLCVNDNGAKIYDDYATTALDTVKRLIYNRKKIKYEDN